MKQGMFPAALYNHLSIREGVMEVVRFRRRNIPPRCTDKFSVRLNSDNMGTRAPVKRSLLTNIDSKSCNLPSGTGRLKNLGPSSDWPNKLSRKHSVCSSSPWIKFDFPESYWIYSEGEHFKVGAFIGNFTKLEFMELFFDRRYRICCKPEWYHHVHERCGPLSNKQEMPLLMESDLEQANDASLGNHACNGRALHQAIIRRN